MRLLAIETATPGSSVTLAEGRDAVAYAARVDRTGHSEFLVPAIDFCFDQAGWSPADLDGIVVDVGPGLYTGLRVGVATAQGLGATLGIPVIPVVSLDALALDAATGRRHIWAVIDVRRGEVAFSTYWPVPGGVVRDGAPDLVDLAGLRARLESNPSDTLVVGDFPVLPEDTLRGLHRVKTGRPRYPSARAVAEIGAGRFERDEIPHPDEIRPLYLREPDVTINWEKLHQAGPWG
ncbi:MAG TPA: tRNA (adenosine(37)-N6)-threonylcarbamoyltransferase complex dimerization subunit type 1 TsaB [Acidimicrobiia bacterium]|nr:tRNA (adenosine(37)-N6)-threonylcarbamoyltransferase complex dimerization subunit type 1 TsaB [Acidimicrobiia bacterium]